MWSQNPATGFLPETIQSKLAFSQPVSKILSLLPCRRKILPIFLVSGVSNFMMAVNRRMKQQ
jgi:hypothetical protein